MSLYDLGFYLLLVGSFLFLLTFWHEFGHYVLAKLENNYRGWSLFPQPHIKLKKPYSSRWRYLSGIVMSLAAFPYWLFIDQFLGLGWHMFFAFALASGSLDLLIFFLYGKLTREKT